jgi:hypothetical protein
MVTVEWFWVVDCQKCHRPIPLYPAPRPDSLRPADDPFQAAGTHLDCRHVARYRQRNIRRSQIRSEG